ncbi:MAG: hypothetical protein ACK5EK_06940 [Flavobacteriia bacterium]|jgi:hypothetical protein
MRTYIASELFTANVNGNFPLDVKFVLKAAEVDNKELFTRGIYTLSFQGELLYIGSYSGQKNVAVVRWQNELQTHSMRGFNVGFTPAAWRTLQGTQQSKSANFPSRIEDSGYLTSAKRVLFAEENWYLLSQNPDNWLSYFSFCWMPLSPKLKRSKKELETLTNQLRKFYKPRCNG